MKKIMLAAFVSISCSSLFAQKNAVKENEVPNDVKTSFHRDFPTAANVVWEKEGGSFEAVFTIDADKMSAEYTKKGYRKELEKQIDLKDLPPAAVEYIKKNVAGAKLMEASKTVTDKAVVTYEARIMTDGKFKELIFDANGKYLKKDSGD